jgi:hypothetical protein
MCGVVGLLGGGVGGMSPVMLTKASIPALRRLIAACGETWNTPSAWAARVGDGTCRSEAATVCSFGSAAGTGGGGGDGMELASLPLPASTSDLEASSLGSPSAIPSAAGSSSDRSQEGRRRRMGRKRVRLEQARAGNSRSWNVVAVAESMFRSRLWTGHNLDFTKSARAAPRSCVSHRMPAQISWSRVLDGNVEMVGLSRDAARCRRGWG